MFSKFSRLVSHNPLLRTTRFFSTCKPIHYSAPADFRHHNTEFNNEDTPFDFTPDSYKEVQTILSKFPAYGKQSAILPLLHLAQRQAGGWIPLNAMRKIAEIVGQDPKKVYEVATFYSMYNRFFFKDCVFCNFFFVTTFLYIREPVGKYHIQVCVTTPCQICGSDTILETLEKHLGIYLGETTPDNLFTLGEMECMGACVNAPMIVVSDYSNPPAFTYDFYEDLTPESVIKVVEAFRRGEKPTPGPQNGRKNSEAIGGRTTLFNITSKPEWSNPEFEQPAAEKPK